MPAGQDPESRSHCHLCCASLPGRMAGCLRDMGTAVSTLPGEDKENAWLAKGSSCLLGIIVLKKKKRNKKKRLEIAFHASVCQYVVWGQRRVPLILEFLRPFFFFLKMYQSIFASQLLRLPNSAGSSQAKSPLSVANSSAPLSLWDEFRTGHRERALASFFSARYRAGWHTRGGGRVQGHRSDAVAWCKSKNPIAIFLLHPRLLVSLNLAGAVWKSNELSSKIQ